MLFAPSKPEGFGAVFLLGSEHWCCEYSHARFVLACVFIPLVCVLVDRIAGMHTREGYL